MWKYNLTPDQDELRHYGVLGMKWGIRRTPEQLGHRKIKAGKKMYITTANKNESLTGPKHVTHLLPDRDLQRGTLANEKRLQAGKKSDDPVYEHAYVLAKDLNVPSRAVLEDVVKKIQKEESEKFLASENAKGFLAREFPKNGFFMDSMIAGRAGQSMDDVRKNKSRYKQIEKSIEKDVIEDYVERFKDLTADQLFLDTLESFNQSETHRTKIINELKKQGYNAMVDEPAVRDRNAYYTDPNQNQKDAKSKSRTIAPIGVDPLIIFDSSDVLKEVSTTAVSKKVEEKASKDREKWRMTVDGNAQTGKLGPW